MTKFRVTFDLGIYAETPSEALRQAASFVAATVERMHTYFNTKPELPTGGIYGEPHSETTFGWRCIYRIEEHE